jgi:hypothetical protein
MVRRIFFAILSKIPFWENLGSLVKLRMKQSGGKPR